MSPHLLRILLGTLLGAALGTCMRCEDCGGPSGPSGPSSPSSSCKEITACGEGERCSNPQPGLGQIKISGNPSGTLSHQHPDCVTAHRSNSMETVCVGGTIYKIRKDCCFGHQCNDPVASAVAPMCNWAVAAVTILAWLLPGLWSW
ncbi:lymphocyte antigen 6 complex locus protein G6d [Ochotona curzoniae]|uniref:lymphocyte antigen 6 complex locus protein G6d n=1 Tax=Ochotona curzoniae TaxID=130825 RepID=UPI001B350AF0|nr:lymphocyte antigen 6 complex locus protein G6d [Ochotona curzoniae]